MSAKPSLSDRLLGWYDLHRRTLPWRSEAPDPYRVWLSEVMLQQTTVAAVTPRFQAWVARWPTFEALASASEAEVMGAWAGLGYYARARNLLACARAVTARGGWPTSEAELRALPGIGDYTAAAIAAIAFGERAVVIDANVQRVVSRLFALTDKAGLRGHADAITPERRAGDFAQAMMDLGATVCTPRAPRCLLCPLREDCLGYRSGAPERFTIKAAKSVRPIRQGTIFWLEADGAVLLVRRPPRGLLGGMRALPTGLWTDADPGYTDAPAAAAWTLLNTQVVHVFTHFRLECRLAMARIGAQEAREGEWWPIAELDRAGLPTLFAKAATAFRRMACD